MERKNIAYTKGITRSPSDMLCSDGELAECVNLEVRNEELVPIEIPSKLGFSCGEGEILVLVHDIKAGPKNYITITNGVLKAFKVTNNIKSYYDLSVVCGNILSIQNVGNVVIVYTENSPHYILYGNSNYKYLGSKIPEVGLSFDLTGDFVLSNTFQVTTPNLEYTSDEFQSDVVNQLLAQVNSFVSKQIDGEGKFMFPFFVRYALRLYDGTYYMQSNPILMFPSSSISPESRYIKSTRDSNMKDRTYESQIGAFVSSLKATVSNVAEDLGNWSDIISGVDIFISKQIYTYDQNGTLFGNYTVDQYASQFIGEYNGRSSIVNAYTTMASKTTLSPGSQEYLAVWHIPMKGLDEIYDEISNVSSFHKFASIGLDEITNGNVVKLEGTISAIETKETLPDDYMTHDVLLPKYSYVYNGRINISNVTRELYQGQKIQCITQMVKENPTLSGYNLHFGNFRVVVCINSANGSGTILADAGLGDYGALWGSYFFYPDPNAYMIYIIDHSGYKYAEVSMSEHPLLNGSYAFIGFKPLEFKEGFSYPAGSGTKESMPNKLFTSEVNNPFHFPLEGINTIGSGDIIGMAAMTRPISTGQAGEAPFIVFCTDGNYALKVSDEGYYERVFPIQEDRVLGSDKITPLEDSVAIITKKGLMITDAGDITRIAENMDGSPFEGYPYISESEELKKFNDMALQANDNQSFLSYLDGSRMAYDYSSNRLIIYNPNMTYTYVYSFDNNTTSKMSIDGVKIITSVIDYPDTIIQDENGNLYSLYAKEDTSSITERKYGVAITRPLKLDNPIAYKIINQIKNLKKAGKGSYIKYALYGSMDGNNFVHVNSLRKRSYLYYIFVLYTYMLPKESFSGTIISFDYRMSHKIR